MLPMLTVACIPEPVAPMPPSPPAEEAPAPLDVACPAGAVNVRTSEGFDDLQEALDAASAHDAVAVCGGWHAGPFVAPVPVTIGGVGATVLAGDGTGPVLTVPGGAIALDLELTEGRGAHGGGLAIGAGDEVVVARTRLYGNVAERGGGLHLDPGAAAWLVDCEIAGNRAVRGGGAALEQATLRATRTSFVANTAEDGGGIACRDAALELGDAALVSNVATHGGAVYADRCTVAGGRADGNAADRYGGGLVLLSSDAADVTVRANEALYGGGVYALASSIARATVAANVAPHGDGIYAVAGLVLTDTLVVDHAGVGLAVGIGRADVVGGAVVRNDIGAESSGGLGQILASDRADWGARGDENGIDVAWGTEDWRFGRGASFTCEQDCEP